MVRRLAALVVGTAVATTTLVAITPSPAHATTCVPNSSWVLVSVFEGNYLYEAYTFAPISSTPTFNVSDTRIAVNDLDNPISVTFTSSQSQTFSISVTATMQAKLASWLTATISSTITTSRTTQIGVSVTASVPPHAGIRGDYGVQAYDVTFRVTTERMLYRPFTWPIRPPTCFTVGTETKTVNAPTTIEGWRVGPL